MPSIDEQALYDDDKENDPENELVIRHMIASTITSTIDVDSFEEKAKGNSLLIDVKFSYKDHSVLLEKHEKFINTDDTDNSGIDVGDPQSSATEKVYKAVNLVTEALAACDYDTFASYCADTPSLISEGGNLIDFLPLHLCNLGIFVNLAASFSRGRIQSFFAEIGIVLLMPGAVGALLFPDWNYRPFWSYLPLLCFFTHSLLVFNPPAFPCQEKGSYIIQAFLVFIPVPLDRRASGISFERARGRKLHVPDVPSRELTA